MSSQIRRAFLNLCYDLGQSLEELIRRSIKFKKAVGPVCSTFRARAFSTDTHTENFRYRLDVFLGREFGVNEAPQVGVLNFFETNISNSEEDYKAARPSSFSSVRGQR